MKHLNILLTALIALTAVVGDHLVFHSPYSDSHVFRGLVDNLVHTAIGLLSSLLFLMYDSSHSTNAIAVNVALCTAVSSLIDFDHIIVARSIHWKDLRNFSHRGIFHCSSVWFAASLFVIAWSVMHRKINYNVLGWMFLIAFTSHHIRDAHRRGFWLWPYGHTDSISRGLYILLVAVLPSGFYIVYNEMKPGMLRYTTVDHQYQV